MELELELKPPPKIKIDKRGSVDFYMNGSFVYSRRYNCHFRRKEIIEAWKKDIRNIMDVNTFYYVINPEL